MLFYRLRQCELTRSMFAQSACHTVSSSIRCLRSASIYMKSTRKWKRTTIRTFWKDRAHSACSSSAPSWCQSYASDSVVVVTSTTTSLYVTRPRWTRAAATRRAATSLTIPATACQHCHLSPVNMSPSTLTCTCSCRTCRRRDNVCSASNITTK